MVVPRVVHVFDVGLDQRISRTVAVSTTREENEEVAGDAEEDVLEVSEASAIVVSVVR